MFYLHHITIQKPSLWLRRILEKSSSPKAMASSELPLWEALAEQEVLFANQKGGGGLVIYMYIYI
jgi:hypothetical protein